MNVNVNPAIGNRSNTEHPLEWPEGALTRVPFWIYQSPEIYALEQQRIFEGPNWNYLCLKAEVAKPGDYRTTFVGTMAVSTVLMATALAAPFINILVYRGGIRWLAAYGVVIAVGASAAALSVALTVVLFRTIGPKRTRLAAQIVAAIVGAAFVIGLQITAILSYGTLSYLTFLKSDWLVSLVPAIDSIVWVPARAVLGDFAALLIVLGAGLAMSNPAAIAGTMPMKKPANTR